MRLGTEQVTEQRQVTEEVRKERIKHMDSDGTTTSGEIRKETEQRALAG